MPKGNNVMERSEIAEFFDLLEELISKTKKIPAESENLTEALKTLEDSISIFESMVSEKIIMPYKEYFASVKVFLENSTNLSFRINNFELLKDTLGLLPQVISEIKKDIEKRSKKCACCGSTVVYSPLADYYSNMREKYGVLKQPISETLNSEEYLCPTCGSSDRDRMIVSYLKKIGLNKASEDTKVLQIAPAQSIDYWIRKNCPQIKYDTTDLFMEGVTFRSDIQDMNDVPNETYSLIICSHVLEHVKDDVKALKEMKRILKKDGQIVFLVPIDLSASTIDEEWGCSEEENWRRFGQGDHCRQYSKEGLVERLEKVFFVEQRGIEYFGTNVFEQCGLLDRSILYVLTKEQCQNFDIEEKIEIDTEIMKNGPLVSVVLPCYNHEPFVRRAIESVINQTYKNIEILVADDASKDGTPGILEEYRDKFEQLLLFDENKGERTSDLTKYAKGKYIALMHSDDIWDENKIAIQVDYLEKHSDCGVCLSWAMMIDENENEIDDNLFIVGNRTREEWIRFFWDRGNALCNPSSMTRREFFHEREYYGNAGRQLPDFFNWIGLLQETSLHIIPKVLTWMTRYSNEKRINMSASNNENNVRYIIESADGWFWVIRDMNPNLFVKVFSNLLRNSNPSSKEEIEMEKYFVLLTSKNFLIRQHALTYFCEIYPEVKDIMEEQYDYSRKKYWEAITHCGVAEMLLSKL